MKRVLYLSTLFIVSLAACSPVKTSASRPEDTQPKSAASVVTADASAVPSPSSYGRQINLYAIRASLTQSSLPPNPDQLPCQYFKQGADFKITNIPGGPPIAIPGPVQNHYSGNWMGDREYSFRFSAWNRLYHDAGIPDWLLASPAARTKEYVPKLFDMTIVNPTTASCTIKAKRLN